MLYLLESEISENKSVYYALESIFGLGRKRSILICKKLGFSVTFKMKNLSKDQINRLTKLLEIINFKIGSELKQIKLLVSKNLTLIKTYRGIRRKQGLPVRGQRTHTNARTARKRRV